MLGRFLSLLVAASLAFGPAADAQFRSRAMPGRTVGLRSFVTVGGGVTTEYFKSNASGISPPAGVTSVCFTAIAAGGQGAYNFDSGEGEYGKVSGAGGNIRQAVVSVSGSDTFAFTIGSSGSSTNVLRTGTTLVNANSPGYDTPASTSGEVGSVGFVGGAGISGSGSSPLSATYYGGGAAGTTGNGSAGSTSAVGARGTGASFTQTSNGETATNGAGNANYGGGANAPSSTGNTNAGKPGIIIAQWGATSC